jgi:hypothetical protein
LEVRWGHNWEKHFYTSLYWKKNLLQKQQLISIKLDATYLCMKGIQVCLDKETNPHQRGNNHENPNIGWVHLKILFSRTND